MRGQDAINEKTGLKGYESTGCGIVGDMVMASQ